MTDMTSTVRTRSRLTHPDSAPDAPAARANTTPADAPATHHASPGAERWLRVVAAACVPAVASIFAPERWRLPLVGAAALLFVAALVMLAVQERGRATGTRA